MNKRSSVFCSVRLVIIVILALLAAPDPRANADPAVLLFQDEFDGENPNWPGWTAVQPPGAYLDGPMLWVFNEFSETFSEDSNIYTDSAAASSSRRAVMLINATVAPSNFTYTARLTAGDDDGFGLIWGYENETTFYRAAFARQDRFAAGWPYQGVIVDRMSNNVITDIFGPDNSFINTANRPFDVTISVTNGLLSLSVADDPEGVSNYFDLVVSQPLPAAPSGKVGFFSWGQSGNGGFRIGNPVLSPTPLTGAPNRLSTNWTRVVTPRSDGTTNLNSGAPPDWGLGINATGNRGWLVEHADAFQSTDNVASGTTNYAASTLWAGNNTWSNYLYYARFQTGDDDGFGLVFRYLNETNFYRIAFRAQNSQSGIKQGWSIQKCVNLVFDQIAAGNNFIPPLNVPIDVYVEIMANRLVAFIISNPTGASPQRFTLGPFDITGSTVDQGKIGILSWAQSALSGTQVDFVRVYQISGESLFVDSAFGTPDPPVGLNSFPLSTVVTSAVENVVVVIPNEVRQINNGWIGTGSVPATGSTNQAVFTLDTLSSITWLWRPEYYLVINANTGGTVTSTLGPWVPAGSNVTVTALANPGYVFTKWSGDSLSSASALTVPMVKPSTLTATFAADSDGDGLPDDWEITHFGNLDQKAADDPDRDGVSNAEEYARGSDPNFAETLTVSDGLISQWTNTQRDPALPGQVGVVDFGSGYRGAYDNSNDSRFANDATFVGTNNLADFASFQSPRLIVRSNLWDTSWDAVFSASMEFAVGDNDGNCFYFRYRDEQNWYRVTVCGEGGTVTRPPLGISVQRRVNGAYAEIPGTEDPGLATDPLDTTGYKRVRVTVNTTNENFEVRVVGWNAFLPAPDFDPASEHVIAFTDASHSIGRIGFGFWGQGGFGAPTATNGIPIASGALVDNIVVTVGGSNVFSENWETAALTNGFPAGWTNAFAGAGPGTIEGDWQVSAHGTFMQLSNFGSNTTGSALEPKADVDGPILLAPSPGENYLLEIGFHPFDDDGIGFVYNFYDTNNYSRVLFVSEATADGRIPQGLSVSRKRDGQWSDVVAGDNAFVYRPGQPFAVEFANNNGACRLRARELDNPAAVYEWQWADDAPTGTNRFGLATWTETDAHFLYARAFRIPTRIVPGEFRINGVALSGNEIVLDVSNLSAAPYDVEVNTNLAITNWTTVASGQTGPQWTGPIPAGTSQSYWRLRRSP